jgi:hypothetical protein
MLTHGDFVRALRDAGYEPRSYNGHGMNGESCLGVEVASPSVAGLASRVAVLALAGVDRGNEWSLIEDVARLMDGARAGDLGGSLIVYWPAIAWDDAYGGTDMKLVRRSGADHRATPSDVRATMAKAALALRYVFGFRVTH